MLKYLEDKLFEKTKDTQSAILYGVCLIINNQNQFVLSNKKYATFALCRTGIHLLK
jgi:hypothetical protein